MYNITITLEPKALEAAKAAMEARGMQVPTDFTGPVFLKADNFTNDDNKLLVITEEKVVYEYPKRNIARVKFEDA